MPRGGTRWGNTPNRTALRSQAKRRSDRACGQTFRRYGTKVTELAEALQQPESRLEATEALRGLVDAIVLTPNGSKEELGIELWGNLAAKLGATVSGR